MTDRSFRITWIVVTMLGTAVLLPYLDHAHRLQLAYPVIAAVTSIVGVIWVCPELRGQLWFWATIVVVAAIHVPLILNIPWHPGWIPAPLIIVFCIADATVILAIIQGIQKLKHGSKSRQRHENG